MTVFAWDASNHDWPRGPMDLAAARTDGIVMFVHKCAEGDHFFADQYYQEAMNRARAAAMPIQGPYFVLHPGSIANQVDWLLSIVDAQTPWWREHPCWVWQIDAEKFSYMTRAPNVDEINSFGDLLCAKAGVPATRVLAYAPQWLYGNGLTSLRYALWASAYGSNPAEHYREAYPGDTSDRWAAYSGHTPLLLQYGSRLTIGRQPGCDASAYRGTLDELLITFGGDDMDAVQDYRLKMLFENWDADRDNWVKAGGDPKVWDAANARGTARNGVKQQLNLLQSQLDALATKLGDIASPGQPTQEQVDAAVRKALADPQIQSGIAAAIAAHLKVV